jgi:4-hydroxybenzoate polyprenyltransferase
MKFTGSRVGFGDPAAGRVDPIGASHMPAVAAHRRWAERIASVRVASRAGEWWEDKLAPILGTGYATAAFAGAPLIDSAGELALVLVALVPGAVYVSLLNDLTDRDVDRLAGKWNRIDGRSPRAWWAGVAACLGAALAISAIAWRDDPWTLLFYGAAWVAFALYSVPPVRLKARGAFGVLADAAGAQLFPHLLMVAAVLAAAGRQLDASLVAAVGCWAFASGVRGALWHQLSDRAADVSAGLRTFGSTRPDLARRLGAYVVFPLELIAFAALLVLASGVLAALLMPAYALLEYRRTRRWGARIVVVTPAEPYRIAMQEYYVAIFPLAFLVSTTLEQPGAALVLAAHLLLFHQTPVRIAADAYDEVRDYLPWTR